MKLLNNEMHIFIIWEHAQNIKRKIISDIEKNFTIIDIYNILWDQDNYSDNMTRFYGQNLVNGSGKEIECGKGRFSLIIVLDNRPCYMERLTSKGAKIVNTRMYDAKSRYRDWTGGGHKIHATNDPAETMHDLYLLLGVSYDNYFELFNSGKIAFKSEKYINKNLIGCAQWPSLTELFNALNHANIEYVVLRNFDGMPENYYSESHGDIDLLVNCDPKEVAFVINASPVFKQKYRVHYKVNIDNESIRFDIRHVGDNYYDKHWEKTILKNRIFKGSFFIPCTEDLKYSLLYHALIHKKNIANDYNLKLSKMGFTLDNYKDDLQKFMEIKGYEIVEPKDLSVYFGNKIISNTVTLKRNVINIRHYFATYLRSYIDLTFILRVRNALRKII
jgi:hypothetical protein